MAAMLAERLGVPQVSLASKVEIDGSAIRIRRVSEDGYFEVESTLPAVISVVEKTNEPRYPSFKGIMAAKKKPVQTLSLADAGIDAALVGLAGRVPRWSTSPSGRRGRRARSSRTRETAASRSPSSSPRRSSSEGARYG